MIISNVMMAVMSKGLTESPLHKVDIVDGKVNNGAAVALRDIYPLRRDGAYSLCSELD